MSWHTTTLESETGEPSFDYDFEQYLIIDNLTGFMIGNNMGAEVSNSVNQNRSSEKSNYETVLFKTLDGGLSFQKSTLGKGSLEQIGKDSQQNLYVIKVSYMNDDVNTKKYSIQKSTDLGISWKMISDFKTSLIKNIQFFDNNNGIVCVKKNKNKYELLKTADGGKSWNIFPIHKKEINILNLRFINQNELYSTAISEDKIQTGTVKFNTGEVQLHDCDLPKGYELSSFFNDGEILYSEVSKYAPDESHQLMLYNHNTHKLIEYDFISSGKELILGVTVSGNYIGVLRQDNGKTYYFYSNDTGENWLKEELPDSLTSGHPVAVYGKGLVWVRNAVRNLYDIQVRQPEQ
ncbi:WD40/YVTN/BNR-like repeat-containing protein [Aquimarina latercula]|uniref:WD40/YVTN/BNR-like repeat-containing protein n=1 Tax=Aquimarina latercula TaxID=987 RepID=UPI0004288704|nr:hypothetical protein [Aquimarina latercula]